MSADPNSNLIDTLISLTKGFVLFGIVIFLLSKVNEKFGEFITVKSNFDGRSYKVRRGPNAQEAADTLARVNQRMQKLIQHMQSGEGSSNAPFDPDISRLVERFDPNNVSEATSESEFTSFTVNKGEKVAFCLKCRNCGTSGTFEPENTLMFVAIHELAHIANDQEGHGNKFQSLNKHFLKKAMESGVWDYHDYSKNPVKYCGIMINGMP